MKSKIALIQILFLCVFVICGFFAAVYFIDRHGTEREIQQLQGMVKDTPDEVGRELYEENGMLSRYYELYERNHDMAGWIKVDGTCIDYPVMYKEDSNAYYLHRNFEEEKNSAGMPFLDYQCSTDGSGTNMIIYGHNMRNGTMFHDLLNYEDQSFEQANPYISYDTLYDRRRYEIFAVFKTSVGSADEFKYYEFVDAADNEEFNSYVDACIAHSLYDTGIRPEYGEQLITLSTCSYNSNNERFVVAGRLIDKK